MHKTSLKMDVHNMFNGTVDCNSYYIDSVIDVQNGLTIHSNMKA